MPGSEDDLGLDLRLPWGRPDRAAAAPAAELATSVPDPPPAAPPDIMKAVEDLRRSVEGLVVSVDARLSRVENRLRQVAVGLPKLLGHIEADLASQHSATVKAVGELRDVPLVNQLEDRIDLVARDLSGRLERVESLVLASYGTTRDALGKISPGAGAHTPDPTKPLPPG